MGRMSTGRNSEAISEGASKRPRRRGERGPFFGRSRVALRRLFGTSGVPDWKVNLVSSRSAEDDRHGRAVTELCLRLAEGLLSTGKGAADVVSTVVRVTQAYGVSTVNVEVTYTSIFITRLRGLGRDPVTATRAIRGRVSDYATLAGLEEIVERIEKENIDVATAAKEFDKVMGRPETYNKVVTVIASGVTVAGVAVIFNATAFIAIVSGLSGMLVDIVTRALGERKVPPMLVQSAGGAVPTLLCVLLVLGRNNGMTFLNGVYPSLIVVAAVVILLGGLSWVGAAEDALSGYYITASARVTEVVILTLGLLAGILAVLTVANGLGVWIEYDPPTAVQQDLVVRVVALAVLGVAFGVVTHAQPRVLVWFAVSPVVTWLTYATVTDQGVGPVTAGVAGGLVAGLISPVIGRFAKVPDLGVATVGILPLVPGMAVFNALFTLIAGTGNDQLILGATQLLAAALFGIGIAVGASTGMATSRGIMGRPFLVARSARVRQPTAD
ncbi:hypothetical protein CGZ92_03640 [Parenemella sanctibonifatiensis]|uniref:Threonine/serine exporter family protein n=2 Tax=Parenemella sanctibonifatiensis TaxID=2016505 RepID=A0A255EB71_9ACTN|nr:hypothetical protein CGZ92_03640 [Parenemella sanctibonifatiensis]